jgi:hypothetical protein
MRDRFNFNIVAKRRDAFARRSSDITICFTDVNENCDARHILLLRASLPTRHETRGHNEYR